MPQQQAADSFEDSILIRKGSATYPQAPITPKVEKDDPHSGKQSSFQAFVHLVKGNVGPGCLSLPYAFSLMGPTAAAVLIAIMACITTHNMMTLARCKQELSGYGVQTYGDIGLYALGRPGQWLVDVFLVIMQLSVCTVYFSFVSSNIAGALPEAWGVSQRLVILLLLLPVARLSLIKHMRQLAPYSLAATLLLLTGMGFIASIVFGHWGNRGDVQMASFDSANLPLFLGNAIYAFEGIGLVLPVENAMQTPASFMPVLIAAMTSVSLLFMLFGEVCLLSYGYVDDGSIASFLQKQDPENWKVLAQNLFISLAVVLTYPIQFYPAIQVLEVSLGLDSTAGSHKRHHHRTHHHHHRHSHASGDLQGISEGIYAGEGKELEVEGEGEGGDSGGDGVVVNSNGHTRTENGQPLLVGAEQSSSNGDGVLRNGKTAGVSGRSSNGTSNGNGLAYTTTDREDDDGSRRGGGGGGDEAAKAHGGRSPAFTPAKFQATAASHRSSVAHIDLTPRSAAYKEFTAPGVSNGRKVTPNMERRKTMHDPPTPTPLPPAARGGGSRRKSVIKQTLMATKDLLAPPVLSPVYKSRKGVPGWYKRKTLLELLEANGAADFNRETHVRHSSHGGHSRHSSDENGHTHGGSHASIPRASLPVNWSGAVGHDNRVLRVPSAREQQAQVQAARPRAASANAVPVPMHGGKRRPSLLDVFNKAMVDGTDGLDWVSDCSDSSSPSSASPSDIEEGAGEDDEEEGDDEGGGRGDGVRGSMGRIGKSKDSAVRQPLIGDGTSDADGGRAIGGGEGAIVNLKKPKGGEERDVNVNGGPGGGHYGSVSKARRHSHDEHMGDDKRAIPCGLPERDWVRVAVCCGCAFIAMAVPNVGLMVSLAGSLGGAVLNLILPPLIDLKIDTNASTLKVLLCWTIIIFGAVLALVGTSISVSQIYNTYFNVG